MIKLIICQNLTYHQDQQVHLIKGYRFMINLDFFTDLNFIYALLIL